MSSDAQIAREWAEGFIKYAGNAQIIDADELTAARYILATTTPTMADIAWDDAVHAGLCAEHKEYGAVRMLCYDGSDGTILCLDRRCRHEWIEKCYLTPIPGTRVDLTPRREPEPESTPNHPTVLTTEADYRNAPVGTIVVDSDGTRWTKWDDVGNWIIVGANESKTSRAMSRCVRRVLRWGWEA